MTDGSDNGRSFDKLRKKFEEYREELGRIGFILPGSITKRYVRCGTSGCKCHNDPESLHGPYYEWTRKVQGKTVTVRLKENEALLLMEWVENKKRFKKTVSKMENVTLEAMKKIRV